MGQGAGKVKQEAEQQQPVAKPDGKATESQATTSTRRATRASLSATETNVLEVSFKEEEDVGEQEAGQKGRKTRTTVAAPLAPSLSRKRQQSLPSAGDPQPVTEPSKMDHTKGSSATASCSTSKNLAAMALNSNPVVVLERLNIAPGQKTIKVSEVCEANRGVGGFSGTSPRSSSTSPYKQKSPTERPEAKSSPLKRAALPRSDSAGTGRSPSISCVPTIAKQSASRSVSFRKRVRFEDEIVGEAVSGSVEGDKPTTPPVPATSGQSQANITPQPSTTANITPQPSTTANITPQPSTTANITPQPSTTANITPQPSTTANITPQPSTSKAEPTAEVPTSSAPFPRRSRISARKSTFSGKKPKMSTVQSFAMDTQEETSENNIGLDQVEKTEEASIVVEQTNSSASLETTMSGNFVPGEKASNEKEPAQAGKMQKSPVPSGDHNYVRDSPAIEEPRRGKRKAKTDSPRQTSEKLAVHENISRRRSLRAPKVKKLGQEFQLDFSSETLTNVGEEEDGKNLSEKEGEIPQQESTKEDHSYMRVSRRKSRKPQKLAALKANALKLDLEEDAIVGGEELVVKKEAENKDSGEPQVDQPYYCSKCSRTFTRQHTFNSHMASYSHGSKDPKTQKCDHPGCGLAFRVKVHLEEHKLEHQGDTDATPGQKHQGDTDATPGQQHQGDTDATPGQQHQGDTDATPGQQHQGDTDATPGQQHQGDTNTTPGQQHQGDTDATPGQQHQGDTDTTRGEQPLETFETKKELPDLTSQEEATDDDDQDYKPGAQYVGRGKSRRMVKPWVPCRYPGCRKLFISKRASSRHEDRCHSPDPSLRYPCTFKGCEQTFTSRHYQARHELADHPNDPEQRPHQCPHCPLRFAHTGTLTKHVTVHNRPKDWAPISHKCTQTGCAREFPTPSKLRDHLLSHGIFSVNHFQCESCGKFFPRKGQLQKHILYTHTEPTHCCAQCDKKFHTEASLAKHVSIEHEKKYPITCDQCNRGFRTRSLLLDHQNIHQENPVKYKCEVCDKEFLVKTYFKQHVRTHNKKLKTHKCPSCDMTFSSGFLLRRHKVRHSTDRTFQCKFCDKTYKHRGALDHHHKKEHPDQFGKAVDDYLNRYACNVCGRTGHTKQVIEKHIKAVHLNLRDEVCPYEGCGKAFVDQNALRSHVATMHDPSLRPFKCDKCDRSFYRKKQLDWHVFSHDKDLSPHQCDSCGKKFVCARTLREHIDAIHNKIRPYGCSYCSKSFSKQHALEDHQRIHTGEKKWPCELCDEKFINTHYRKVHKVKVHGLGHRCPQCNLSFMSILALERHQKRHEGEKKTTRMYRRRQPRGTVSEDLSSPAMSVGAPAEIPVSAESAPNTSQQSETPAAASQSDSEKLNCEFCPESFLAFEEWEDHLSKEHKCMVTVLSETGPDGGEPVYKAVIQPTTEDGSIPNMTKMPGVQVDQGGTKGEAEDKDPAVQKAPSSGGTLVAEAVVDESYATKTMLNLIDKLNNEAEQTKEKTETSAIQSYDVISGDDYASRTMLSLLDQLSTDAGPTC